MDEDEEWLSDSESSDDEDNPNHKPKDPETEKKDRIERAKQHRRIKQAYILLASLSIFCYLNLAPNPFNGGVGLLFRRQVK